MIGGTTFKELGFRVGERVRCVERSGRGFPAVGVSTTLQHSHLGPCLLTFRGPYLGENANWERAEAAPSDPIDLSNPDKLPLKDLPDAVAGALVKLDSLQLQRWMKLGNCPTERWVDFGSQGSALYGDAIYRAKPTPEAPEAVTLYGREVVANHWGFGVERAPHDTHKITGTIAELKGQDDE